MNYGMFLSASGVLTNSYRMDVFANNLANSQTAGFKPDFPGLMQRDAEAVEDRLGFSASHDLLDRLGGGTFAGPQSVSWAVGVPEATGRPLDLALLQDDTFLAVHEPDANGELHVRLTRDGRLSRNADGRLVTQSGYAVLGLGDVPIDLPEGMTVTFNDRGELVDENEQVVGRVQVVRVSDRDALVKRGQNLFGMNGTDTRSMVDWPELRPGHVEASAVDPISTLMQLINSTKAMTGNMRMITYQDQMADRLVNTFGRVS